MASLKFAGDINELSEVQIKFLRDVLSKRGFEDNSVVVEPAGKTGDNFAANVKRVKVLTGSDSFNMIMKLAPSNEQYRTAMHAEIMFNNETVIYNEILPKYDSLQASAGIPKHERLRFAECYGSLTEAPHEIILLEDLGQSQFAMLDRSVSITDEAAKLILRDLAIFHSLSFVLKKQEPETYERFRSKLIDYWSAQMESELFTPNVSTMENEIIAILDNDKYKTALKGSLSKMQILSKKLNKDLVHSKHSVIIQGDAWINNILFKFENDVIKQSAMIDYQLSRENSPVSDILYMVFNCTDYKTRAKHYHDWLEYYHDQLNKSLNEYGLKANFVYPKDKLEADLQRFSKMYFASSLLVNSMLVKNSEEIADFQDSLQKDVTKIPEVVISSETTLLFKSRVEELVDSYLDFGYLKL